MYRISVFPIAGEPITKVCDDYDLDRSGGAAFEITLKDEDRGEYDIILATRAIIVDLDSDN